MIQKIKHIIKYLILVITIPCVSYSSTTYTQYGRYLSVTTRPITNDPFGLNIIIQRQFPKDIVSIGDALQYVLNQTGYQIVPLKYTEANIRDLYKKPLPIYLRNINPMPMKDALLSISGQVYQLVVDPVNKLITFKVRPQYQNL